MCHEDDAIMHEVAIMLARALCNLHQLHTFYQVVLQPVFSLWVRHSSEIYNSYNTIALEIVAVNSPCPWAVTLDLDCSLPRHWVAYKAMN